VPGDPLCGALLATHGVWSWRILPCVGISLAAYCAGLVINDLADFSEDLRDRPTRPLPSGAVSRPAAVAIAGLFIFTSLVAASTLGFVVFVLTLLLLAEILWYNLLAKKNAFFAPIEMGLCRGLSVLVGAVAFCIRISTTQQDQSHVTMDAFAAVPAPILYVAAATIALYIAGVTVLARKETTNPRIPTLIGSLIRALLFIQAGFCLAAGGSGWIGAILLLALWPISRLVGCRFYAS
jgi:4-hydroxybenzoate polyprenyltransferase